MKVRGPVGEEWWLSEQEAPIRVRLEPGVIVPLNVPAVENVSTVERMRRDPGHWAYEEPKLKRMSIDEAVGAMLEQD